MPGCVKFSPDFLSTTLAMASKNRSGLKPKWLSTMMLNNTAPAMSSVALTICTQVVARDREPVLPALYLAAGGVELDGGARLPRRPDRDPERDGDDDGRNPKGGGHDPNPMRAARRRTAAASGSNTRLARRI